MKRTAPQAAGEPVRINRYLSMCGVTSRRKAEDLVNEGRVTVNGRKVSDLATRVVPGKDRIKVDGSEIALVHDYLYIVLNKPKDTITTASAYPPAKLQSPAASLAAPPATVA